MICIELVNKKVAFFYAEIIPNKNDYDEEPRCQGDIRKMRFNLLNDPFWENLSTMTSAKSF